MQDQRPSETLELRGRIIEFGSVWGEVVGCHKHAETRVYGGGGGGTNGNSSPVSIGSRVTVVQEFFLKPHDGGPERAVALRGVDVPIRDGQAVTMVSAKVQGVEGYYWVRLVNHTAERSWIISDSRDVVDGLGFYFKNRKGTDLLLWIIIIAPVVLLGWAGLLWSFIALIVISTVNWSHQRRARRNACAQFDDHCAAIVKWTFAAWASRQGDSVKQVTVSTDPAAPLPSLS